MAAVVEGFLLSFALSAFTFGEERRTEPIKEKDTWKASGDTLTELWSTLGYSGLLIFVLLGFSGQVVLGDSVKKSQYRSQRVLERQVDKTTGNHTQK